MVYGYKSIDPVVAAVIRNTRVSDTSFIADMHDWISEALSLMSCHYMLAPCYANLDVYFHSALKPCDMAEIEGVEYGGHRLRLSTQAIHPKAAAELNINKGSTPNTWVSIPHKENIGEHEFYSSTLVEYSALSPHPGAYYILDGGAIITSFETGRIRVHGRGIKKDKRGIPLIPDLESVRQACYFYCRKMMVGAGFEDPVYKIDYLEQMFDLWAGRAIGRMSQETPEMAEAQVASGTRFVPPDGYYESFFSTPSHEGTLL
jgi:hypothetical protein